MKIHGNCQITIKDNDPATGKQFLCLTFDDGVQVNITTNIAEMIGGAGAGVRKRREDLEAYQRSMN